MNNNRNQSEDPMTKCDYLMVMGVDRDRRSIVLWEINFRRVDGSVGIEFYLGNKIPEGVVNGRRIDLMIDSRSLDLIPESQNNYLFPELYELNLTRFNPDQKHSGIEPMKEIDIDDVLRCFRGCPLEKFTTYLLVNYGDELSDNDDDDDDENPEIKYIEQTDFPALRSVNMAGDQDPECYLRNWSRVQTIEELKIGVSEETVENIEELIETLNSFTSLRNLIVVMQHGPLDLRGLLHRNLSIVVFDSTPSRLNKIQKRQQKRLLLNAGTASEICLSGINLVMMDTDNDVDVNALRTLRLNQCEILTPQNSMIDVPRQLRTTNERYSGQPQLTMADLMANGLLELKLHNCSANSFPDTPEQKTIETLYIDGIDLKSLNLSTFRAMRSLTVISRSGRVEEINLIGIDTDAFEKYEINVGKSFDSSAVRIIR